jgi:hypothetical protein
MSVGDRRVHKNSSLACEEQKILPSEMAASPNCHLGQGHCPLEQQLCLGGTLGVKKQRLFSAGTTGFNHMSLRARSLSFRTAAWLRRNSWCKEQSSFQQEQPASIICPLGQGHCPLEQQLGLGGTAGVKNSSCFRQEQLVSLICPLGQGHCPLEQHLGL